MIDRGLRRELYDHLAARMRGEVDAEATRQLILKTQTDDRGYWIVVDQMQALLPDSGTDEDLPALSRQLLGRCMIFLRTGQEYQWETDFGGSEAPGIVGRGSVVGREGLYAAMAGAIILGTAALGVWLLLGREGLVPFYGLSALGLAWLLVAYLFYWRQIRRRPAGEVEVWPFFDRASYETARAAFAQQLAEETGGRVSVDLPENDGQVWGAGQ